jgi:ubiquitin carboxyl-terminal hydrolase 7
MKYEQLATKVAEHLKVQPTHLRFSPPMTDGRPRSFPIKRSGQLTPIQQLTTAGGIALPPIVYYEVLELTLADMESKREITISWLPDGLATMVLAIQSN